MSPRRVQFSVLFHTPYMRNADVKGRHKSLVSSVGKREALGSSPGRVMINPPL